MSTPYDRIPEQARSDAENRLRQMAEVRAARTREEQEKLHSHYGDYNEREFTDHLSQVYLADLQQAFSDAVEVWVPLFFRYARASLDELRDALLATPVAADMQPWHLQELKSYREQSFRNKVAECAQALPVAREARALA